MKLMFGNAPRTMDIVSPSFGYGMISVAKFNNKNICIQCLKCCVMYTNVCNVFNIFVFNI